MPDPNRGNKVDQITVRNIDMKGRRVVRAADAVDNTDYTTLRQVKVITTAIIDFIKTVREAIIKLIPTNITKSRVFLTSEQGEGALELLSYAEDNQQVLFDCSWNGTDIIAKYTSIARIVKNGDNLYIYGTTGATPGDPVTDNLLFVLDLSNGNVSIRTGAAPAYALDVNDDIHSSTRFVCNSTDGLLSVVFPLAKLTPGGTDGHFTVTGGIITEGVFPT